MSQVVWQSQLPEAPPSPTMPSFPRPGKWHPRHPCRSCHNARSRLAPCSDSHPTRPDFTSRDGSTPKIALESVCFSPSSQLPPYSKAKTSLPGPFSGLLPSTCVLFPAFLPSGLLKYMIRILSPFLTSLFFCINTASSVMPQGLCTGSSLTWNRFPWI